MKMAVKDGTLLIREATREQQKALRAGGQVRWSKKEEALQCPAGLEFLDFLAGLCKLPEKVESLRARLRNREMAMEYQRNDPNPAPICDYPVKAKLYQHQIRAANMALLTFGREGTWEMGGGFGLLFEMGCGKTLTAMAITGALYNMNKVKKVLVVAPASVCAVWPNELGEYAAFPVMARVLAGDKRMRLLTLAELETQPGRCLRVAVINYESAWREEIFDRILEWGPDLVIADESQRIKNPAAAQSKAMHRIGDTARYRLILSGTPVQNGAEDLWSQYRFLDPTVFGKNFYAFRNRYAVMGGYQNKKVIGYRHIDELIRKEHSVACRVTKAEALDLPEQVFETRFVEFSAKEQKLYNELRYRSIAELENTQKVITASTVLTKLTRLQQLTGGFLTADGEKPVASGHGKLDAVADILEDYVRETGKKLVVFARFLPELDALEKLAAKKGYGYVRLDGGVPMKDRGELVRRFQEDTGAAVFLGQIDTVGLGVTLTAADTAVYYSCNYNYAAYEQSLSRIHRIGQKNSCTYIHLAVPGTVDEQILKILAQKGDLAKSIVDNWRDYL